MDSCNKHDCCIVVYTGRDCPVCELESEIKILSESVREKETRIEELNGEVDSLNEQLTDLEDKVNH